VKLLRVLTAVTTALKPAEAPSRLVTPPPEFFINPVYFLREVRHAIRGRSDDRIVALRSRVTTPFSTRD
jgi:hypothetical protein